MLVLQARKGVRLQGPLQEMTLIGAANAYTIFDVSTYAAQVGTRTFRLKRVKGLNAVGANTLVHIGRGTGAGFVDMIPPLLKWSGVLI